MAIATLTKLTKGDKIVENKVFVTKDYSKFKRIMANRDTSRNHINALKNAIMAYPKIIEAQPIIVNEDFEIIDGQHRFQAAVELGIPVTYSIAEGAGIEVARSMNVLQRAWTPLDYAKSYAMQGNRFYQAYIKARDDYELTHSIVMTYLAGRRVTGENSRFKKGQFEVENLELARADLDKLLEIQEIHRDTHNNTFAYALLRAMGHEQFDYARFLEKFRKHADTMMRRSTIIDDNLRMIEDIYNASLTDKSRVRLF